MTRVNAALRGCPLGTGGEFLAGARLDQACQATTAAEHPGGPGAQLGERGSLASPACHLCRDRDGAGCARGLARRVERIRLGCPLRVGAGCAGEPHGDRHRHRLRTADQTGRHRASCRVPFARSTSTSTAGSKSAKSWQSWTRTSWSPSSRARRRGSRQRRQKSKRSTPRASRRSAIWRGSRRLRTRK